MQQDKKINYLTFGDDFAIIVGANRVAAITPYQEAGNNFPVIWFRISDADNHTLMLINSAAVEIVGYDELPDDDDTL